MTSAYGAKDREAGAPRHAALGAHVQGRAMPISGEAPERRRLVGALPSLYSLVFTISGPFARAPDKIYRYLISSPRAEIDLNFSARTIEQPLSRAE